MHAQLYDAERAALAASAAGVHYPDEPGEVVFSTFLVSRLTDDLLDFRTLDAIP